MAYRGLLRYHSQTVPASGSMNWVTLVDVNGAGVLGSLSGYDDGIDLYFEVTLDSIPLFSGKAPLLARALGITGSGSSPLGFSSNNHHQLILNLPFTNRLVVRAMAVNGTTTDKTVAVAVRYLQAV